MLGKSLTSIHSHDNPGIRKLSLNFVDRLWRMESRWSCIDLTFLQKSKQLLSPAKIILLSTTTTTLKYQINVHVRFIDKNSRLLNLRSLEVIGGHWRSLEAVGGLWRQLEVIGGHWRPMEVNWGQLKRLIVKYRICTFIRYLRVCNTKVGELLACIFWLLLSLDVTCHAVIYCIRVDIQTTIMKKTISIPRKWSTLVLFFSGLFCVPNAIS